MGFEEGRQLGVSKGFEMWEEIGFYEGFALSWKYFFATDPVAVQGCVHLVPSHLFANLLIQQVEVPSKPTRSLTLCPSSQLTTQNMKSSTSSSLSTRSARDTKFFVPLLAPAQECFSPRTMAEQTQTFVHHRLRPNGWITGLCVGTMQPDASKSRRRMIHRHDGPAAST